MRVSKYVEENIYIGTSNYQVKQLKNHLVI
jgi:hypothetical protein